MNEQVGTQGMKVGVDAGKNDEATFIMFFPTGSQFPFARTGDAKLRYDKAIEALNRNTTAKPETAGMREENAFHPSPLKAEHYGVVGDGVTNDTESLQKACDAGSARACFKDPNHLLDTMDANKWATEFCSINKASDHATMLAWFACAIMTGYDTATRDVNACRDKELNELRAQLAASSARTLHLRTRLDAAGARGAKSFDDNIAQQLKDQGTIKSLTAQNEKKQQRINDQSREILLMNEHINMMQSTTVIGALGKLVSDLAAKRLV